MMLALAIAAAGLAYPPTPQKPVVETIFGERVVDAYRWLEGDPLSDRAVRDWATAQDRVTRAYLDALPERAVFAERLRKLYDFERYGVPRKAGGRVFYTRNAGLQPQAPLYVRDGDGGERLLIDPNRWSDDGSAALAEWAASPDGRRLAYAVQEAGRDWRTIRVVDVATGASLSDELARVKFSAIAWLGDGSGFFYSRFPEPPAPGAVDLDHGVWLHRLGSPQSADQPIYATPDRPRLNHSARVTDDGRYLIISSSLGTDPRAELSIARLDRPRWRVRALVKGFDNAWRLVGSSGANLWLMTDLAAPLGRVVLLDAERPGSAPITVVPQGQDSLAGASLVGERLIVAYTGDARPEAVLYTLAGRPIAPIPLPAIGTAVGFGGRAGDPETFFSFSGPALPPTLYRFDTNSGRATLFAAPRAAFDPADYVTRQLFYASKDGTRIPIYLVKRRDAKGSAPTLLYGYGGFNIAVTPSFSAARMAWLEQGGTLALASLRGGAEYGKAWHDAGRLALKQNVFDDFIAAAEWLIATGETTAPQLAIQGSSNGGLLVGAVVNQRPDLFAAALPASGVMDMLRFDRFTVGRTWIDDYGDPAVEADWRVLRSYSPYHNIAGGRDYPAILVSTADTDDRVLPLHSFKYAAALQAADIGAKPHLLSVEANGGHGQGRSTERQIADAADGWSFAAHWTGLRVSVRP